MIMNVKKNNLELIHSAVTHFLGEPVIDLSRFEDTIVFQTGRGTTGVVESNFVGNYDIWIGEEVVYEIEKELFDVIEQDKAESQTSLIEFYNSLKTVNEEHFKYKSKTFFNIVKSSIENIILNHNLPMVGDATIGSWLIHYTKNNRIKVNLN